MNKCSNTEQKEKKYIQKRLLKAHLQSIPFYLCRIFPVNRKKIAFCCIEGTTGYSCNPKYIARELISRNSEKKTDFEFFWLVNDTNKKFPPQIKVVKNTLWKRAYTLATAGIWIDNSRKQLEVRKRKEQLYIQTWHARLGFKPTCMDRGASFSRIAYLVSKHDSDMVDYWLSNSDWYDKTLPTGSLYEGKTLRTGSPRCDILINANDEIKENIRKQYQIEKDARILMYAPTFRGGSQGIHRELDINEENEPDFEQLIKAFEKKFGGKWYLFLRMHPQLTVRNIHPIINEPGEKKQDYINLAGRIIDVSQVDDMYELLAGCNAFLTDYSSAAFDAAAMRIPVFIYAADYKAYEKERGSLLWDLKKLPFPLAQNRKEMSQKIECFEEKKYQDALTGLFQETGMMEDGEGSVKVANFISNTALSREEKN